MTGPLQHRSALRYNLLSEGEPKKTKTAVSFKKLINVEVLYTAEGPGDHMEEGGSRSAEESVAS